MGHGEEKKSSRLCLTCVSVSWGVGKRRIGGEDGDGLRERGGVVEYGIQTCISCLEMDIHTSPVCCKPMFADLGFLDRFMQVG